MHYRPTLCVLLLVFAACGDLPYQANGHDDPAAAAIPPVSPTPMLVGCTRSWANGVDGDWNDATMWVPVGVPTSSDSVCIAAAGTYTVTLEVYPTQIWVNIQKLRLGGSATRATLVLTGPTNVSYVADLRVYESIWIVDGSELVVDGGPTFDMDVETLLTNDGRITILGAGYLRLWNAGVNNGTIEFAYPATMIVQDSPDPLIENRFTNSGTIIVSAATHARVQLSYWGTGSTFEMLGGTVTGTQRLEFNGLNDGILVWAGGTFESNPADTALPLVQLFGTSLELANTALRGRLELRNGGLQPTRMAGDVGPDVKLLLSPTSEHTFQFETSVLQPDGVFRNRGMIDVAPDTFWPGVGTIELSLPGFINRGALTVARQVPVELSADSVLNFGSIDAEGEIGVTLPGTVFRNHGSIAVGAFTMLPQTTFDAVSGSTMAGRMWLEDATLMGEGEVGNVLATDASIQPGAASGDRTGTLTAVSLDMQGASSLLIDVADTVAGDYDQLVIAGEVNYGGTLSVVSPGGFQGGRCGQVLTLVIDGDAGDRGAFATHAGMTPGPGNNWRLYEPSGSLQLVGFNPLVDIFRKAASLTVTEGGPVESFPICLGPNAPTADVVIDPERAAMEIEVAPNLVTFPLASWQLPRWVQVFPLNDSDVEGQHADTVTFTVASGDPRYDGFGLVDVNVTIIDNDGAATATAGAATAPSFGSASARERCGDLSGYPRVRLAACLPLERTYGRWR